MVFDKKYIIFVVIFLTGLIIANVSANRIGDIGYMTLAGSPICFGVTFLLCDIVNELYGKEHARFLVRLGLLASIVMLLLLYSVKLLPAASFAIEQDLAFDTLFKTSWRIVLASQLSYYIGNMIDISIFGWFREKMPKYSVLRKNFSTWISQLVDSGIFCSIAFIGIFPLQDILTIFVGEYLLKVLMSLIDTPLFYIVTKMSKKNVNI